MASCLGFSRSTVADHVKRGTRRLREYLRRRSLVLPAAIGWTALLESASAREVPPGLVHSLHAMAGCVVGRTAPLVMSTELGVFVMSSKKIVAATLLAFLLLLGAGVAILARTTVWKLLGR